jgi:hypothetical protein
MRDAAILEIQQTVPDAEFEGLTTDRASLPARDVR